MCVETAYPSLPENPADDIAHNTTLDAPDVTESLPTVKPKDALYFHDYDWTQWEDSECDRCTEKSERVRKMQIEIQKLKGSATKKKSKTKPKIDENDDMFKKNSKLFRNYTGIDRETFDVIFSAHSDELKVLKYWQGPSRTINIAKRRFFKPGPKRKMTPRNELFMALIKLKTGLNMAILGSLFSVSEAQASRTIVTWFKMLAKTIGSLVYNPDKGAVISSRPSVFEDSNYRDVRHIIDATEIFIETPKSLKLAAACYSDYKHHHTVKYLVSINPNGHINYVSRGWGGRASDNHVTQHCGFLDILEPFDKVSCTCLYVITAIYFQSIT